MMSASPLPGFLAHLEPVLLHYGYLAVGGFVLLEDFGVPVVGVGLIAFLAAVIGDNLGYVIGHFGGRALVLRYGRSSSSWW